MHKGIEKLFGDRNKRLLKQISKDVEQVNAFEEKIQKLTDEQLRAKTAEYRKFLNEEGTIDDIKHEAFAVVREAARRTLGQDRKSVV